MWRRIRTVLEAQGSEFHSAEEALRAVVGELDLDWDDSYTAKRAHWRRLGRAVKWPVLQREGYDPHPCTVDLQPDAEGPVRSALAARRPHRCLRESPLRADSEDGQKTHYK